MEIFLEKIVSKFLSIVIIIFLTFSTLLFSSVSFFSKLVLSFLLVIIFLTNLYFLKKFFIKNNLIVVFSLLFFLFYLFLNTYLVSKIRFESKTELLNFCFYIATFFVFYEVFIQRSLEEELVISFLIVQLFLFLVYIFGKERLLNFFVYNTNIFACYCLFSWLFSFFYLYLKKQNKLLVFITLTISSLFLLFLKSFSAIFVVITVIVFIFIKNRFLKWVIIVSLFLLFSVINFNSVIDRIIWLVVGLKIWLEHFFFGVGLGNFKFYYPQYLINVCMEPSIATIFVHNYFVHLAAETGVVGLFLFLFFIFYILKKTKNKIFLYPLYGVLIQNFFDYVLYIPQNSILFFIFLSSLAVEDKNKYMFEEKNRIVNLLYFLFLLIFLLYCIISFIKMDKIMVLVNSKQKDNFYKAVSLDETCWLGWKYLAVSFVEEENLEEAKKMFTNVIKTNPFDVESYFYISVMNFKFGNKSDGYKFLKQMLQVNPKLANKYIKILKKELG